MRPSCSNCVRKHLAQAVVLVSEAERGYPLHAWYAVGHIAEAEEELVVEHPDLANELRQERLGYMSYVTGGERYVPKLGDFIEKICLIEDDLREDSYVIDLPEEEKDFFTEPQKKE